MKLLIVGYGRMGRLVEELAPAQGCEVVDRIDVASGSWDTPADVAIDFSTADALEGNFARYVERKLPVVIGATGPVDAWPTFWRYITSGTADPTGRPLA